MTNAGAEGTETGAGGGQDGCIGGTKDGEPGCSGEVGREEEDEGQEQAVQAAPQEAVHSH